MNTSELIRRAEQELADGNRSAKKTIEQARRELLRQRDIEGLEHLLDLAGRLDDGGDLAHAIRQNIRFLSRTLGLPPPEFGQDGEAPVRHSPETSVQRPVPVGRGVFVGLLGVLVGLLGAFLGFKAGVAVGHWAGGKLEDALLELALVVVFVFAGVPLGAGLAVGMGRLVWWAGRRVVNPSRGS